MNSLSALDQLDSQSFARLREMFELWVDLPRTEQDQHLRVLQRSDAFAAGVLRDWLDADATQSRAAKDDCASSFPRLLDDFSSHQESEYWQQRLAWSYGPYRLLRLLGRGGMGAVFLAERRDGHFEQSVAIKLLRPKSLSQDELARFVAERQILARLSHPHIARLFDGGVGQDGSPYVVMEHVDGEAITRYAARRCLDLPARLKLMTTVCGAVDYAHQQMIVHRDLKPANILVDQDGQVKLLDFGVAGLLYAAEDGSVSVSGAVLAYTPAYAAPEQLRGDPVAVAADVYALGLLLFELLFGCQLRSRSNVGVSAPDPACFARLQQPQCREFLLGQGLPPAALQRALKQGLDAIICKALAANPELRYIHVSELIDDLNDFQAQRPLRAVNGGNHYRLRCLLRRHRLSATLLALLACALLGGVLGIAWQAVQLAQERDRVVAQAEVSRQTLQIIDELFASVDPTRSGSEVLSARQLIDHGRLLLSERADLQPGPRTRMLTTLAWANLGLGDLEQAATMSDEAAAIQAGSSEIVLELVLLQTEIALRQGNYTRAEGLLSALPVGALNKADSSLKARFDLAHGRAERALGRLQQATERLSAALQEYRHQLPAGSGEMLNLRVELIYALTAQGHFAEAGQLASDARAIDDPRSDRRALLNLRSASAMVLHNQGRLGEARQLREELLAELEGYLDADHPRLISAINDLAAVLHGMGELGAAATLFEQVLLRQSGVNPPERALALSNLASARVSQQQYPAAITLYDEAVQIRQQRYRDGHYVQVQSLFGRGVAHLRSGDSSRAIADLDQATQIAIAHAPDNLSMRKSAIIEALRARWQAGDNDCSGFAGAVQLAEASGGGGWLEYGLALQLLCEHPSGELSAQAGDDLTQHIANVDGAFGSSHERSRFLHAQCRLRYPQTCAD